jgi:glycerol-3-phosphate O-acyltransferase
MNASAAVPWANDSTGDVVYLLDCLTRTERRILERSVREHCPAGADMIELGLRQQKPSLEGVERLRQLYDAPDATHLIPLRVCWRAAEARKRHAISLRDLITGETGYPGALRQRWLEARGRDTYEVVAATGAALGELKRRLLERPGVERIDRNSLAGFIYRSAFLALERSERSRKGARYKIPRMISEEVLGRPRVVAELRAISSETGRSMSSIEKEARSYLTEMAAAHTTFGMDLAAAMGRYIYTRGFDEEIDVPAAELERIRALLNDKPVAFAATHKSHIDGFLVVTLFHDFDLPPLHFFGGINMKLPGIGAVLKKAGTIYIRRSFQDNAVYKVVFRNYIDYLGEKRFPLMWALEGTRSRTGKLMPPRYGMINYVVSAYVHDNSPDLVIVPISIVYDHVPEIGDYDAIQAGATKRPESFSWFMQYFRSLQRPHGSIHVRFGKGVQLSDIIDVHQPVLNVSQRDIQKIAFELAVDANSVTPITINALITYVLLTHGHGALTLKELISELTQLGEWIRRFGLPTTADVAVSEPDVLERSLRSLQDHGAIAAYTEGVEPVYAVAPGAARKAAYYRNGMLHFAVTSAIADLALISVNCVGDDAYEQFREQALKLRDLLKFEFFFEGREEFLQRLEQELELRAAGWRMAVVHGGTAIRELLTGMSVIFGHAALRPFLEAYTILAESLSLWPQDASVDNKALLANSQTLGRQRLLQQRIHCEESVSRSYFENAIQIAGSRGLLETTEIAQAGRQKFLQELTVAVSATHFLSALAGSKRFTARSIM